MKLSRPLKFIRRLYHGKLRLKYVWSWASKCGVMIYATGLSIEFYFITILFMWVSNTICYKEFEILNIIVFKFYVSPNSKRWV